VNGSKPISNLRNLTFSGLKATTVVSDHIFGAAVAKSGQRAAQDLELPSHFVRLLFAIEDKRFFYHAGIDFLSIMRALFFNIVTAPSRPHGASTITQQIYSNSNRRNGTYHSTIGFKVAQSAWALKKTLTHSKLRVLREYLDSIYFGKALYGLDQAAEGYCGQIPHDLTVAESFFLVERIARPNKVSISRVKNLATRNPIATILNADPSSICQLAILYERHFDCGEVIAKCLEKSLRKQVVHTFTCLGAASSEQ